mgnify:CR=1 FL=1
MYEIQIKKGIFDDWEKYNNNFNDLHLVKESFKMLVNNTHKKLNSNNYRIINIETGEVLDDSSNDQFIFYN